MKKYLAFMFAAAAMLFAVSCSDNDDPQPGPDPGPTPEPAPSPTYKPSLYYLGTDTATITKKYDDMTGQMLEVRYYLNTNMNKLPADQLTINEIEYYYCYFVKQGADVTPYSAYGKRDLKAGKDLVSHKGHEAMFGDYKMPKLEGILSLDEAIKIIKDAAAAPGAQFKCPRTGAITLHRPVDPQSAGRLFYTFGDDGSGKYVIALDAYTGQLDIRQKPDDPSPDYEATLYWLGEDTTTCTTQYAEFKNNFKKVEYKLNAKISEKESPDDLTLTQIDYFFSKGTGDNADLCKGTRTSFGEGDALNISKYQGQAINEVSIPNMENSGGHSLDDILDKLYEKAEQQGAKFLLPATDKVTLRISPYKQSLGDVIYDFGPDGSGQYIIVIEFHSQTLLLEEVE